VSPPQLLLDENLSERLLPLLIERFPHSTHVRLIGLGGASDTAIWKWASQQLLVLVTKDEDFLDLSVAWEFPPKVVCLAIGNASNAATASLLLQQADTIEQFCSHPDAGFLLLQPSTSAT
jgi:predicted nuclease of predicted toxin-antitoxin system